MIDINELCRLAQAAMTGPDGVSLNWVKLLQDFQKEANPAAISELLDRLEAAEKERDALRAELSKQQTLTVAAQHIAEVAQSRANQLRARVEAMEKQDPVAWCATDETGTVVEALGMNQSSRFDTALYLAPGAKGEEK